MHVTIKTADNASFNEANYPQGSWFTYSGTLYKVVGIWTEGHTTVCSIVYALERCGLDDHFPTERFIELSDGTGFRRVEFDNIELVVS